MFLFFSRCAALLALLFSLGAQAGIIINTTRVIYPAQDKEVSFGVHNTGTGEILVQSWLEPNAEHTDADNLPLSSPRHWHVYQAKGGNYCASYMPVQICHLIVNR